MQLPLAGAGSSKCWAAGPSQVTGSPHLDANTSLGQFPAKDSELQETDARLKVWECEKKVEFLYVFVPTTFFPHLSYFPLGP